MAGLPRGPSVRWRASVRAILSFHGDRTVRERHGEGRFDRYPLLRVRPYAGVLERGANLRAQGTRGGWLGGAPRPRGRGPQPVPGAGPATLRSPRHDQQGRTWTSTPPTKRARWGGCSGSGRPGTNRNTARTTTSWCWKTPTAIASVWLRSPTEVRRPFIPTSQNPVRAKFGEISFYEVG